MTAAREEARVADTPASVAIVPAAALRVTASGFLDDALRQVVGFSLFRRTGSRTANPTAQGVSLRGLGASGASRALVLADGVPLNDPFGGWVYWARLPRLAVERIEVLRGGAADLYGSGALGGAVQLVSTGARDGRALEAELAAGEASTFDGSLSARAERGDWAARLSAEGYTTDGYVPVAEPFRGPVDSEAASRHFSLDASLERRAFGDGRAFLRLQGYDEDRENGTALQTNDTRIGLAALGLDWGRAESGRTALRLWAETQTYHQTFTAIAADRTREDLTRQQRVPADALGASAQWARALGSRQRLLVGAEARHVSGTTEEVAFVRGTATATVDAGGDETGGALFLQDLLQAHPRLLVSGTVRLDAWALGGGRSVTTPLATGVAATTTYPDRDETALSPRLGLVFRVRPGLSLTASGYGAFRAPTLNELYRSFRVGDTLTLANAALAPERLWGGEAGVLATHGRHTLRVTAFSAEVTGRGRQRDDRHRFRPDHARAAERRPHALARTRGGGRPPALGPRRGHRRLRAHGRPRRELSGRPHGSRAGACRRCRSTRRRCRPATRAACGSGCSSGSPATRGRTTATSSSSPPPRSSTCSPATRSRPACSCSPRPRT